MDISTYKYKRVLLKISGEALKGKLENGYDADAVNTVASRIAKAVKAGVQIGLVAGAGNVWRGAQGASWGLDRASADYMGMLATVMNGICLREAFRTQGIEAIVQSPIVSEPVVETYDRIKAIKHLQKGRVVIFSGGTGSPFFTTDTAAALRALETNCEAVLKATKVDGIYTDDPMKDPNAERYKTITFSEALAKKLKVMDSTAFSMCGDNNLPIIVFNFSAPESLEKVLQGNTDIATVVTK